jgi:hypothetical protein
MARHASAPIKPYEPAGRVPDTCADVDAESCLQVVLPSLELGLQVFALDLPPSYRGRDRYNRLVGLELSAVSESDATVCAMQSQTGGPCAHGRPHSRAAAGARRNSLPLTVAI